MNIATRPATRDILRAVRLVPIRLGD
jgi:hypothetical protein